MEDKIKTRHVAVMKFTYEQIRAKDQEGCGSPIVEAEINKKIDELAADGKKVISLTTQSFGFSPALLVYTIIYE